MAHLKVKFSETSGANQTMAKYLCRGTLNCKKPYTLSLPLHHSNPWQNVNRQIGRLSKKDPILLGITERGRNALGYAYVVV